MPTGYTHPVQKGEVTEFKDFALRCARAMGALIMMRDEPTDAPIPDEFEPSDFDRQALQEAEERLHTLRSMTPEEIQAEHREVFDRAYQRALEYRREKELEESRYQAMLKKVRAWEPPTPDHEGLKRFMVEQLESSIEFDCGGDWIPSLPPADADTWWKEEVASAQRAVKRHKKGHEEEVERARARSEWVRELKRSLEPEEVA